MRVSGGLRESEIVVGNVFNKYGSRNPIVKVLMHHFEKDLQELVEKTDAHEIHEVGCGEGYWVLKWLEEGRHARGSDFSSKIIDIARENAEGRGLSANFRITSIYDLLPEIDAAELVVCCEVLEHLEDTERALEILKSLAKEYLLISVPREPLWSVLNMARGKYLWDFGNTPGHIQKWSKRGFTSLIDRHFSVIDVRTPLPWTMILCRVKKHA